MFTQELHTARLPVMTDPEWIALESLDEETRHFIFDDEMLLSLRARGLVEPKGNHWGVTAHGHQLLHDREV